MIKCWEAEALGIWKCNSLSIGLVPSQHFYIPAYPFCLAKDLFACEVHPNHY